MLLSQIKQLKLRLQFTGWLQYIPIAILAGLFLFAAWIAYFLAVAFLVNLFVASGLLLLLALLFDLLTVKLHLHPREQLPNRKDHLDTFDLIRARHSCRSFQAQKLTSAHYDELMGYVRLHSEAPTLGNAPVRFEYISAPLTVWPVVGATEFLVAIAPSEYNRLAVIDVGRSLQKIVIDATRMGLATCWIGPGADQSSIAAHLGERFDKEKDHLICACAIGYKSRYKPLFLRFIQKIQRNRLPISELFFADNSFCRPLNINAPPFNRFGRNYEICQWSPSSFNGQTTRCVAIMEQNEEDRTPLDTIEPKVARFDFYAATASRYYAAVALGIWYANWEMGCATLGINGHSAQLSTAERGSPEQAVDLELPSYDISWILGGTGDIVHSD